MSMAGKRYNPDGPSAEERALERFTELMIKKISSIKGDWKKPWFTENFMAWPKNLSGREYNGMNALMLMLLCEENSYKLPVFCTFQRVSGLNYSTDRQGNHKPLTDANGERLPQVSVLKGEKSFPVFITTFTVVDKETKEKIKMDMERELEHLLDLVGLDMGYRDRFPHELSGGQLQRVCIARAIAVNPRIILFDEAISSLDAHTQVQVMDLLKEIQRKRNLTYVFITHDLTSVTYICHNVLFLYQGRVAEVREVDCISQVEHPYAKKLLNSIVEFDDRGIISREEEERRIWEKAV